MRNIAVESCLQKDLISRRLSQNFERSRFQNITTVMADYSVTKVGINQPTLKIPAQLKASKEKPILPPLKTDFSKKVRPPITSWSVN
jgi:hypothetical protein